MGKKKLDPGLVAFGARLKEARSRRGWNQTALAYHVGKSQGEISEYEHGLTEPKLLTLLLICRELGVSADHLLGLDEKKPR